jgi:chorismate mutase/prephenate dehydrogenase
MVAELTALRDQIDEVDKALLGLLARRLELVAEVGEVKSQYGLPIYVPEREAAMLASRREEASALGVPPDLIEDVLRRVMRESYSSENDKGFKTLCPNLRPVVIVGGGGQMGRLFEKMLTLSGYQVRILEKDDWARAADIVADAGMVIVSVPIHATVDTIGQLPPLPADCILVDLASVKAEPLQAMLAAHRGPVLGLHPMFGPDSGSLAKQVVVYCDGRQPESGAPACTVSAPLNTIRIWLLFRRYVTLRPLPMACIWRKKTFASNSCWRCHPRSTALSWRWLAACLRRIRSCMRILLCHRKTIWR